MLALIKKNLKIFLNIIKDLNLNLKETLMSEKNKIEEKQKLIILKNIKKRFSSMKKTDIEQQLKSHKWLNQLIEEEIQKCYNKKKKKVIFYSKLFSIKCARRFIINFRRQTQRTKVPANQVKKITQQNIFSNIIKQIPSESYKKFTIDYDQSDNISTEEVKKYEPPPDEDKF